MHSRLGRLTAGILVALALIAPPGAASAADPNHAVDFDPHPGSHVELEPSRVTIAFARSIPKNKATIVVRDASGADVTNGVYTIEANNIYAQLPYPAEPGLYTVHYRVSDDNGTPFGGEFQFAWKAPGTSPKGHTAWRGPENIPPVVALEGDPTPPGGSATDPTPDPSESTSASPTEPTGPDGGEDVTPRDDDSEINDGTTWWPWLLALVLAAALGGLAWWLLVDRGGADDETDTPAGGGA